MKGSDIIRLYDILRLAKILHVNESLPHTLVSVSKSHCNKQTYQFTRQTFLKTFDFHINVFQMIDAVAQNIRNMDL